MFVIGWVGSCTIIIVYNAGDALGAPISLLSLLRCHQAQLNDGMVNASCFAVMMLQYNDWNVVFSIVDSIVSRVGKRGNTDQLVSP